MAIVLTGGAGFIGSCFLRDLNNNGIDDIYLVDNVSDSIKWKNLCGKFFREYINKKAFLDRLQTLSGVTHIIHLGACSSTTENDFDYLWNNNVEFSKELFKYAADNNIPFIYASSAATYGNGEDGFSDVCDIKKLTPLNRYGYSKHFFDMWVEQQSHRPSQVVGLKFFNVYGPNEYHKNDMASMVLKGYEQIRMSRKIKLFKSNCINVSDGEQKRDFIYVKDICKLLLWLIGHNNVNGLFNVGCGQATSFNELANSLFSTLDLTPKIEYIDMPPKLVKQYQNYTVADISSLRSFGFHLEFTMPRQGIFEYVKEYLINNVYY